jgi:hypothetical protein
MRLHPNYLVILHVQISKCVQQLPESNFDIFEALGKFIELLWT